MPQLVEIPTHGVLEFPDEMSEDEMELAIRRNFPEIHKPKPTVVDQLTQGGTGIISGFWSLGEAANKVLQVASGRLIGPAVSDSFGEAAAVAREKAQEWEKVGSEIPGSTFVRHVGAAVPSVLPSLAAAPLGFPAMVVSAGLQQFGGTLSDAQAKFEAEGSPPEEAFQAAIVPATLDALQTSLVTAMFGKTGVEAIKAAASSAGFRQASKEILKQAGMEAAEESSNQLISALVQKVTYEPELTIDQALGSALEAAGAGAILGGGVTAVKSVSSEPRALTPQEIALFAPKTAAELTDTEAPAIAEETAPLTTAALSETPSKLTRISAPSDVVAEDMGAVLIDAHEMAAAKVKTLGGIEQADAEVIQGKLEDWVREEAEKYQAANGTLDGFSPKTVIDSRTPTAIEFVQAQKRGGGAAKVPLDQPTEEGGTVGEAVPTAAPAPSAATQENEMAAMVREAVAELPAEERAEAERFLTTGRGRVSASLAGKLRSLVEAKGLTVADLEPSLGPGAASASDVGGQKERKFSARFAESEDIEAATRERTSNRYYDPRSNEETNWMVNWRIQRQGLDAVYEQIRNNDPDLPGEEKVAGAINITKRLNAQAQALESAGKTEDADAIRDKISSLIEVVTEREGTALGRTIQAFRMWSAMSPEGFLRAYVKAVNQSNETKRKRGERTGKPPELAEADPEVKREIIRRGTEIQKLPEGFQRDRATIDLLAYMKKQSGVSPGEIAMSWWYASILSSPVTQAINAISGFLNVTTHAFLQAAINPRATPQIFISLATGAQKGIAEAKAVLKTGDTTGKPGGLKIPGTLELLTDSPSAFKRLLSVGRYVGRAMVAADMVNYKASQEMRALLIANEIARTEGLSGKQLTARVVEILNESPETQTAAAEQAAAEGLTGTDLTRRTSEIIEQGRPDDLNDTATTYALRTTFNSTPYGVLGVFSRYLNKIGSELPAFRFIMPFVNIVGNVTNEGLNYTPWGFKRWYWGAFADGHWFDPANSPVGNDAKVQAAQALSGSAMMIATLLLWANEKDEENPWFDITAFGPKNKNERYQWMQTGARPYSVKLGERWYSYAYTPFAIGLSLVGNLADGHQFHKMDEKSLQARFAYAFANSASVVFNQSFLTGLADFLSSIQNKFGTESPATWGRLLARTSTAFAVPQAVKWVDKAFDPEIKDASQMQEFFLREIPVARSKALKPILNVLGQPVRKEGAARFGTERFWSDVKSDPLWAVLVAKQAFVPVPSKNTKIGDRTITPEEYYEYVKESGRGIDERLRALIPELQQMDAERAQKLVDRITRQERERARPKK